MRGMVCGYHIDGIILKPFNNRLSVRCLLYTSPASMEGSIPFDEQIYMEGVVPTDSVSVKKDLEDLSCLLYTSC